MSVRWLLPDFLGIGAMKSGTSWLFEHLAAHPQVWMGRKEIHFFDRRLHTPHPLLRRGLSDRLRYGARFLPGALRGRITGECTPAYAILDREAIALVHSWMPDVKILFIMRDPVERAWSHVRHLYERSRPYPVNHAGHDELLIFLDSWIVRKRGDYLGCLRNWLAFYRREQFWFAFLDEVRNDPVAVLRDVFGFLGIDSTISMDPGRVATPVLAGQAVAMPDWVRDHLRLNARVDVAELEELVGRRVPWSET